MKKRLDKTEMGSECPVISASNIRYEIAERTRAISAGGIGDINQFVKRLELDKAINQQLNLFKIYLPYSESDHVQLSSSVGRLTYTVPCFPSRDRSSGG
jgi:hypothetical protein